MTLQRRFGLMALLCLLWPCGSVMAQTVTVRVRLVYLKNGKPAKGKLIVLDLGDPQRIPPAEWRSGARSPRQTTSSDGVAAFQVPQPLPRVLFVEYYGSGVEGCAREDLMPLEEVIRRGITVGVDSEFGPTCKGDRRIIQRMAAKPGEIVIFVRKLGFWDKLHDAFD